MKITIVGRKFTVTEDLKQKVHLKLSKLDKFFDDEATANVTMRSERNKEILETTIFFKGTVFRSEVAEDCITAALDKSIDIIERQIRKNKTKLEKRFKGGASFDALPYAADDAEEEYKVTRTKQFKLNPMSVEEAILQMNLLGHEFFLFLNETDESINLVYKKKNNEYGVIEPII